MNRPERQFTVGLLGAGQIAREQHFPILAALPRVSLVWVSDIDKITSRNLARTYGCKSYLPDQIDGALNEINLLVIALPYGVRAPYYRKLQYDHLGIALFIEKPLAKTVSEHCQLAGLRPSHRVACNFNRRASSVVNLMKQLISEGFWGRLKECRFGLGNVGGYSVGEKYYSSPEIAGGGMLFEVGVHCLDAVLYCTDGSPMGEIRGEMIMDNGFDIHTSAMTAVRLLDDTSVPFSFQVSLLQETSGCLEFLFDQYIVSFSLFDNQGIKVRKLGGKSGYVISQGSLPLTGYQTLGRFWMRYFEALDSSIPNETSAASSLGVTCLVEAAYALAGGSSVQLPCVNGMGKDIPNERQNSH